MILPTRAFDAEAVFLDDIVDDDVLPNPTLAVDGLTTRPDRRRIDLEIRREDIAPEPEMVPITEPVGSASEFIEVYGWETSFWAKLRGYFNL